MTSTYLHFALYLVSCLIYSGYTKTIFRRQAPAFSNGMIIGSVTSHHIEEASGLAASRKHPGYLYTHNDHGTGAHIYVINSSGHRESTITLHGVTSHDWEDIAIGPCAAGSHNYCIYIADTGDANPGATNIIYRIPEPDTVTHDITVAVPDSDKLHFSWSQQDCETLMVSPDAEIYIISKEHNGQGVIAQLPKSAWGSNTRVAVSSTAILNVLSTNNDPVGGDISPSGTEVLVKTHHNIYYWDATNNKDYVALLVQTPGTQVPYINEPQGESVAWDATGSGYYTLSEGKNENLYHYVRS